MFGGWQGIGLHCALPSMEYISHIQWRKGLPSEVKRRQKVAFVMVSEISWKVPGADSGRPGLGATQAPALVQPSAKGPGARGSWDLGSWGRVVPDRPHRCWAPGFPRREEP